MPIEIEFDDALFDMMSEVVKRLQEYLEPYQKKERSQRVGLLLLGIASSMITFEETFHQDSAAALWANIEAGAKANGLEGIATKLQTLNRTYSVADIGYDDTGSGMNYLGQKLAETLFKHIHDLPEPLRKPEMLLRAVEVLLTNLLLDTFETLGPREILDSFTQHVQMALDDLNSRKRSDKAAGNSFGSSGAI